MPVTRITREAVEVLSLEPTGLDATRLTRAAVEILSLEPVGLDATRLTRAAVEVLSLEPVGLDATRFTRQALEILAWETIPAGGTTEAEQLSIPVSTECDGVTGTLTLPADWPVREIHERYVVVHPFESGHRYRNARALGKRRIWEIEADAQAVAETDTLRAFFDSHDGTEIPFTWTTPQPRAEVVTVRFQDDTLKDELRAPTVGGFSFRLEEAVC